MLGSVLTTYKDGNIRGAPGPIANIGTTLKQM